MLDAFIIDQIRRREEERRDRRQQPYADTPQGYPLERLPERDRDATSGREDDDYDGRIVFDM